tara:strand:+ start:3836 stop:4831 length:996 start_codon:yes stop_codon:yes gene_type:complete
MATYKEVHGTNIQVLSSDPSVTTNGQIWYNSTSGTLKGFANKVNGSWVTGGAMNTARTSLGSANAGTQTAALGFGANTYGNPGITESYNGSTWTETGDLNNKREALAGAGTQTAALAVGGYYDANEDYTEKFNGSSWTEVGDLNTARRYLMAGGATNTASLAFGGYVGGHPPSNPKAQVLTESWDGSSWTEVGDLNTAVSGAGGCGTQTASIQCGGNVSPGIVDKTELWNGTGWTEVNNLNTARYYNPTAGTTTAAICMGGSEPPFSAATEIWNGTSWTTGGSMSTARYGGGGAGTTASSIVFAGYTTTAVGVTEEYTGPEGQVTETFSTE